MNWSNIIFILILIASVALFARNIKRIIRNIKLGKSVDRSDNPSLRWKTMLKVALGQSKMVVRPIAGIMHVLLYIGFVIINIEVIEIIIDGIFGTHRVLSFMGAFYNFLIASFEVLAILVLVACIVFFVRRNIQRIKRFWNPEMKGWPTTDANLILIFEIILMTAFLFMNAGDNILQQRGEYAIAGSFPISNLLTPLLINLNNESLLFLERFCWWVHIVGILAFLNYLAISKHLHIIFAFPNTYFSNLNPKGQLNNMSSVTKEVQLMLDPNADPFANSTSSKEGELFGAKDVIDLNWVQLLNAYSCTECDAVLRSVQQMLQEKNYLLEK